MGQTILQYYLASHLSGHLSLGRQPARDGSERLIRTHLRPANNKLAEARMICANSKGELCFRPLQTSGRAGNRKTAARRKFIPAAVVVEASQEEEPSQAKRAGLGKKNRRNKCCFCGASALFTVAFLFPLGFRLSSLG